MKMIFAIVNNDDAGDVMKSLAKEHIPVTKLASTGGFLMKGNTNSCIIEYVPWPYPPKQIGINFIAPFV